MRLFEMFGIVLAWWIGIGVVGGAILSPFVSRHTKRKYQSAGDANWQLTMEELNKLKG